MALIHIDVVREFGGFGGLGVLSVLAATLTLAPALIRLRPLPPVRSGFDRAIRGHLRAFLVRLLQRWRIAIIGGWALLVTISALGLSRLEVETDAVVWFPQGSLRG